MDMHKLQSFYPMNHTAAVRMILVLFMLCSVASNRLRLLSVPERNCFDWKTSLEICNGKNESSATVYDAEDATFLNAFLKRNLSDCEFPWLGLRKKRQTVTTWSDGAPVKFNISRVTVTNGEQICEAVENNTWTGFNCSDKKPFMCYKDNNYTLIEKETKNWCQARLYCRKHFTDLVSIRNETQNQEVIDRGRNKSFWIGLQHDEWEWTDNSCSTYKNWSESDLTDDCVVLGRSDSLRRRECDDNTTTLCSKGSVRIIAIDKNLTWEQAFDYCEANHTSLLQIQGEDDQKAVKQFLSCINGTGLFWVGLRQSRVFGFWIWRDSTVSYSYWKNDKQPEMPLSNNCGVIDTSSDHRWRDENCWLELPFLCEEEISFMN